MNAKKLGDHLYHLAMAIVVASLSPLKFRAVELASPGATVVGVAAPSGVSEQPVGRGETRQGKGGARGTSEPNEQEKGRLLGWSLHAKHIRTQRSGCLWRTA